MSCQRSIYGSSIIKCLFRKTREIRSLALRSKSLLNIQFACSGAVGHTNAPKSLIYTSHTRQVFQFRSSYIDISISMYIYIISSKRLKNASFRELSPKFSSQMTLWRIYKSTESKCHDSLFSWKQIRLSLWNGRTIRRKIYEVNFCLYTWLAVLIFVVSWTKFFRFDENPMKSFFSEAGVGSRHLNSFRGIFRKKWKQLNTFLPTIVLKYLFMLFIRLFPLLSFIHLTTTKTSKL